MPKIFQLYRGQLRVKDMNLGHTEDAIHQLVLNMLKRKSSINLFLVTHPLAKVGVAS